MNSNDPNQRIAQALVHMPWLSLQQRSLILETRWDLLSAEEVTEFVDHVIPLVVRTIETASASSPVFADVVRKAARDSANRASSPESDSLVEELLNGHLDHANILSLFASILLAIPVQLKEDDSLYHSPQTRRLLVASIVADLYALHGTAAESLHAYARVLNLDMSSLTSPRELTSWLREHVPHPLDGRRLSFLGTLIHCLANTRQYSLAAVVGRHYFAWDHDDTNGSSFSADFAESMDRLLAREATLSASDESANTLFRLEVTQAARVVNRLYLSLRKLDNSTDAPSSDSDIDSMDADQLLDAIFVYHSPACRFDFRYYDLLSRINPAQDVLPLASEWIISLARRELFNDLADGLLQDTPYDSRDWWSRPDSTGRTYVASFLIERAFGKVETEVILGFLVRILQPDETRHSVDNLEAVLVEIGDILAQAPHPAARAAANLLVFSLAMPLSEQGLSPLVLLERFLGFTTPGYFASKAFVDYVGRTFANLSLNMRDARNFGTTNLVWLCHAALMNGHILKGSAIAIAIIRSNIQVDGEMDQFFARLADATSSFLQVVIFSLEVASEYHPRLAHVALRGIERFLGLSDLRRTEPEELKQRIVDYCDNFSENKPETKSHVAGLSCATRILAELGSVPQAIAVVDAMRSIDWQDKDERVLVHTLTACQVITSLIQRGHYEEILRLTDSLPTLKPGGVTFYLPHLPNHPAYHHHLASRVTPRLAASRLLALRQLGRTEEAYLAVSAEYPASYWDSSSRNFSPMDLYLARECAAVMCQYDPEYVLTVLELFHQSLPEIMDWVAGAVTVFEASVSDEIRHSFIRIGATAALAVDDDESSLIRHRHVLFDAALSHRLIVAALNEPRSSAVVMNDNGFRDEMKLAGRVTASRTEKPHQELQVGDTVAFISIDQPEFKCDWVHPALIKWAHNEEERLLSFVATTGESPLSVFTEEMLADVIGGGKLLRVHVTLNERITWTIFHRQRGKVEVLATNQRRGEAQDLRKVREAIQQFERELTLVWNPPQPRSGGKSSRELRDQAAKQFLDVIGQVIDAADIAQHLAKEDELIVWPDDDLFGIPFSMLEYSTDEGSRFLFEKVETIRTIVSPLVDHRLQQEAASKPVSERRAMVTVSHLGDAGHSFVEKFMHSQFAEVLQRTGRQFEIWGEDETLANGDVISKRLSDLADVRIALMAVMGHGERVPQGVRLGDEIWDGSATYGLDKDGMWLAKRTNDLSNVDFWLQISCSIGRLRQNGLHDATGFCVNLFRSRAEAVLAGRWTLHAGEGIQFAGDVARHYLQNYPRDHEPMEPLWQSRIRSRAVAAVRKAWATQMRACDTTDSPKYGIETVANMDYYGLG